MSHFVVFADMLGFAQLTLQHPPSEDDFTSFERPEVNDFLRASLEKGEASPLVSSFVCFHTAVDEAVFNARRAGGPVTSVAFSDSAFMACENIHTATQFASSLLNKLLPMGVMVRVGIAHGTFTAIRFRADVGLNSGDHAAQFLGTGVVRAYSAAERSGFKGARILLHPSIQADPAGGLYLQLAQTGPFWKPIEVSDDESRNTMGIKYEMNYLGRHDRNLYKGVYRASQSAPPEAAKHYEDTFKAMNRMRKKLGRDPVPPKYFDSEATTEG